MKIRSDGLLASLIAVGKFKKKIKNLHVFRLVYDIKCRNSYEKYRKLMPYSSSVLFVHVVYKIYFQKYIIKKILNMVYKISLPIKCEYYFSIAQAFSEVCFCHDKYGKYILICMSF